MRVFAIVIRLESFFASNEFKGILEFEKLPHIYGIVTSADLSKVSIGIGPLGAGTLKNWGPETYWV